MFSSIKATTTTDVLLYFNCTFMKYHYFISSLNPRSHHTKFTRIASLTLLLPLEDIMINASALS